MKGGYRTRLAASDGADRKTDQRVLHAPRPGASDRQVADTGGPSAAVTVEEDEASVPPTKDMFVFIDPGIQRTGVALFDSQLIPTHRVPGDLYGMTTAAQGLLASWILRPPTKGTHPERYRALAELLLESIEERCSDDVWRAGVLTAVVETPAIAGQYRRGRTTMASIEILNRAIGTIQTALLLRAVPVLERQASTVSKANRRATVNMATEKAGRSPAVTALADVFDAIYLGLDYLSRVVVS